MSDPSTDPASQGPRVVKDAALEKVEVPPSPASSVPERPPVVASASTTTATAGRPTMVAEVTGEIVPGSAAVWAPASYSEWEARARLTTFLDAWREQAADERLLRRTFATWIFWLITGQVVVAFGLVIADGMRLLNIDTGIMQVLIPSVLAEVFGLGFVVTKYLFSQPLRQTLDALAHGTPPGALLGTPSPTSGGQGESLSASPPSPSSGPSHGA